MEDTISQGDFTSFIGEIKANDAVVPIRFSIKVTENFDIVFRIGAISIEDYIKISKYIVKKIGDIDLEVCIEGKSDTGMSLKTDTFSFDKWNVCRNEVQISGKARKVTINSTVNEELIAKIYILRDLKIHRIQPFQIDNCKLLISGSINHATKKNVGQVEIIKEYDSKSAKWEPKNDRLFDYVHLGLKFGLGRHLNIACEKHQNGIQLEETYYNNTFSDGQFPVFRPMELQKFLITWVGSHNKREKIINAFNLSINWLTADTPFDEVRLINAMIGLEALVEAKVSGVLSDQNFKLLKTNFNNFIVKSSLNASETDHFLEHFKFLNKKPLKKSLMELASKYEILGDIVNEEKISALVNSRNKITHSGQVNNVEEILKKYSVAREIIVRVLLKEIGYSGEWQQYNM